MNRGSLHTLRRFRRVHLSVFRYRLFKNGFTGPKSFRSFRETDPRPGPYPNSQLASRKPCLLSFLVRFGGISDTNHGSARLMYRRSAPKRPWLGLIMNTWVHVIMSQWKIYTEINSLWNEIDDLTHAARSSVSLSSVVNSCLEKGGHSKASGKASAIVSMPESIKGIGGGSLFLFIKAYGSLARRKEKYSAFAAIWPPRKVLP